MFLKGSRDLNHSVVVGMVSQKICEDELNVFDMQVPSPLNEKTIEVILQVAEFTAQKLLLNNPWCNEPLTVGLTTTDSGVRSDIDYYEDRGRPKAAGGCHRKTRSASSISDMIVGIATSPLKDDFRVRRKSISNVDEPSSFRNYILSYFGSCVCLPRS